MKPLPKTDLEAIGGAGGAHWDALRSARIFLTGGTGFFGRWIIESFVHANARRNLGASLTILSRSPSAFLEKYPWLKDAPGLEWLTGDVRSFEFPEGDYTHVIHAATPVIAIKSPEDAREVLSIIIDGTSHILGFCKTKRVRRLLLISSGAVYGSQPATLLGFPENWSGAPDPALSASAYGEGKRVSETMGVCASACDGFEIRIARCFAFVGPGLPLDTHFAAGNFIGDILKGIPPRLKGDPNTVRSYLYASDLTAWLWRHLSGDGHAVINVGSDEGVTLGDLANSLSERYLGKRALEFEKSGSGNRYMPDIGRARENGSDVGVDLRAAFEKTIVYHQENNT